MAITLDSTPGGASANSFVSEAEVIDYAATRLNVVGFAGPTLTETEKAAVCEATREISMRRYRGTRATEAQALTFPQWNLVNPDSPNGFLYDTNVIPQRVKDACCELSFEFVKAGTSDIAAYDTKLNIIREKVDVLETEYANPITRAQGLRRYPRVWTLLSPLFASSSGQTTIVRG